jgi:hypothetical protein
MTSPSDREVRFNLRTSEDERACAEDVQGRMGGSDVVSLNTAFCLLIVEGYHWRVAAAQWDVVPIDSESMAYVRECADELGITTALALQLLIRRGAPHQPQKSCTSHASRVRGVPPDRIPTHPQGRAEAPNGPRYATPKPPALPPVAPVTGQVPFEGETT